MLKPTMDDHPTKPAPEPIATPPTPQTHTPPLAPLPVQPQSNIAQTISPTQSPNQSRLKLMLPLMVGLVVALCIGVALASGKLYKKTPPKAPVSTTNQGSISQTLSNPPARTNSSDNVSRKNDVAKIGSGLVEFESNNNGAFPQTVQTAASVHALEICGSDCSGVDNVTVNLGFYTAANVSLHIYSSTLTVPDGNTAYIITRAMCNGNQTGIGVQTTNRATVILYAFQIGSIVEQQCQEI